jgi:hypothetical protein
MCTRFFPHVQRLIRRRIRSVMLAVGVLGDYGTAAPDLVERDSRPRARLPLDLVAFSGRWSTPVQL